MHALSVKVYMFEEGHIFSVTPLFLDIATDASVKRNASKIYLPTLTRLLKICNPLTGAAVCLNIWGHILIQGLHYFVSAQGAPPASESKR